MIELDRIDRKLLYEIGLDSRQSMSGLSQKLRLGNDLVEYRLKRFIDKGYIKRFSVYVDPSALGLTIFKTYIRTNTTRAQLDLLIRELQIHPRTDWIAEMHGRWNLVFTMWAYDVIDFQQVQDQVFSRFGPHLKIVDVFPLVEVEGYTRRFLADQRGARHQFTVSSNKRQATDNVDYQLLQKLSSDSRRTAVDLASELNLTPAIVRYRIEKLQKQGVILGYRVQVGYDELRLILFKLIIHRSRYDHESEDNLRTFCRNHPNVLAFIRQIGRHTIEIEIEVSEQQELYKFTDNLFASCGDTIQSVDSIAIRKDYFHRMPIFLVNQLAKS